MFFPVKQGLRWGQLCRCPTEKVVIEDTFDEDTATLFFWFRAEVRRTHAICPPPPWAQETHTHRWSKTRSTTSRKGFPRGYFPRTHPHDHSCSWRTRQQHASCSPPQTCTLSGSSAQCPLIGLICD